MTIHIEIIPGGAAKTKEKGGWTKSDSPLSGFTRRITDALYDSRSGDMIRITGIPQEDVATARTIAHRACGTVGVRAKVIVNKGVVEVVLV